MTKTSNFLLGCDPEMFLKKDGKFISAHDVLPGTKLEPFPVEFGALQVDGVAAEFNITPAKNSTEFVNNISQVITSLRGYSKDLTLSAEPYAIFDEAYFKALPEEVRELGCNPDFNAYTGLVNPSPNGDTVMRTASGHIHAGWCKDVNPHDKIHFKDCCTFIKQLDFFVGLYSLMWDADNTRRQLYGKAGAFRPKSYGAEYRVLSNVWLRSTRLQVWIFDAVQAAKDHLFTSASMESQFGTFAKDCIDNNTTDWITTTKGRKIHEAMGMLLPDCSGLSSLEPPKKMNVDDYKSKFLKAKKMYTIADMATQSVATWT